MQSIVAASYLAPFAGHRVPVVAFTFGLLHGFSYTYQPFQKASLRDTAIGTGVAVDKMLALIGQTPAFQNSERGNA